MAVTAHQSLTIEEFHARYDGEKPNYEYWAGEAIRKSIPTKLHGFIQLILGRLLLDLGYWAATEVRVKLDPNYEPVPDVVAMEGPQQGLYATERFAVAAEILSPDDSFSRTLRKCKLYENRGIEQIIVIDPNARIIWRFENGIASESDVIARRGERSVFAQDLWTEVDRMTA